jgi:hypothetical protein
MSGDFMNCQHPHGFWNHKHYLVNEKEEQQ